jgi:hypothetical protein
MSDHSHPGHDAVEISDLTDILVYPVPHVHFIISWTIWQFPITSLDYNCRSISKLNDGELFGQSHPHILT